jgi:hypothetical protein
VVDEEVGQEVEREGAEAGDVGVSWVVVRGAGRVREGEEKGMEDEARAEAGSGSGGGARAMAGEEKGEARAAAWAEDLAAAMVAALPVAALAF